MSERCILLNHVPLLIRLLVHVSKMQGHDTHEYQQQKLSCNCAPHASSVARCFLLHERRAGVDAAQCRECKLHAAGDGAAGV